MARMVDADRLLRELTALSHGQVWPGWTYDGIRLLIERQTTLTPPNEPLTLDELKAEAKRQGYKLIKDENIHFEPCLCGGTRREWWSGPEGHKVVCLRCGLESPWVPRSKGKNGVKKAWNTMILEKRKEQING